jgi:hypothetical protein
MSSLKKLSVATVLMAVAAGIAPLCGAWAEEAQMNPLPGAEAPVVWETPQPPVEVAGRREGEAEPSQSVPQPAPKRASNFEPEVKKLSSPPAWKTREGMEEATRRVLFVPPKVWEGMVKGRRVTRVIVRERGRVQVIYAGPRITKSQVNHLIAQWSKRAGFVFKSFVEARDREVFAEAKKYTDSRVQPLEKRVSALERKQSQVQKAGQVTNWLALALVLLMIVIGGCALWRRPRWRQVMY